VVVITGDGDCLAIGGNHLIHACRRNLKLTCLMLNNEVYGMTGGQVSPTTSETRLTTTTPLGNSEPNFDACALAAAAGASFVGREVTHHVPKLKELIRAGWNIPASPSSKCSPTAPRSSGARTIWAPRPRWCCARKRPAPQRLSRHRRHALPLERSAHRHPHADERPEYGAAYRKAAAAQRANAAAKASAGANPGEA